jgi:hypothetical protein
MRSPRRLLAVYRYNQGWRWGKTDWHLERIAAHPRTGHDGRVTARKAMAENNVDVTRWSHDHWRGYRDAQAAMEYRAHIEAGLKVMPVTGHEHKGWD